MPIENVTRQMWGYWSRNNFTTTMKALALPARCAAGVVTLGVVMSTAVSLDIAAASTGLPTPTSAVVSDSGTSFQRNLLAKPNHNSVSCPVTAPCQLEIGRGFGNTWINTSPGLPNYFKVGYDRATPVPCDAMRVIPSSLRFEIKSFRRLSAIPPHIRPFESLRQRIPWRSTGPYHVSRKRSTRGHHLLQLSFAVAVIRAYCTSYFVLVLMKCRLLEGHDAEFLALGYNDHGCCLGIHM